MAKTTTAQAVMALTKGRVAPVNRGEARKHLKGKGPHLPQVARVRVSNRRVTTRGKREEQRERVR